MTFKKGQKPPKKGQKMSDVEVKKEETPVTKAKKSEAIGDIGGTVVTKPQGRIKFEAQVAPFPMFMLPTDIKRWLVSNGLTTDVYKKDKEWLEKHNVDMEMVEKLKNFLTERL